jgi:hypothetical protein
VDVFLGRVPEIRASLAEGLDAEPTRPFTPGDVCTQVFLELLDERDRPRQLDTDIWPRIFAFLEVAEELIALLEAELGPEHEDVTVADAFVNAGILCDVTRNAAGLQELLPWMGPETTTAARCEVEIHEGSRGWGAEELDWSVSGTLFVPNATLEPEEIHPID